MSHSEFDVVLERLRRLARNLWWSWNEVAQRPFTMIDPAAWEATNHDPLATILRTAPARLRATLADLKFLEALAAAEVARDNAMGCESWFDKVHGKDGRDMRVSYFCSEYAIHESLPQYSGGLGVLAGDHVKSASDLGIPFIAVGLLYRHGYYLQQLEPDGRTRVLYPEYDYHRFPIEDTGVTVTCPIGARGVRVKVWRQQVGRVPIYLLDADLEINDPEDRELTAGLYMGEPERRLRQQVLLGVGGVMALSALGEETTVDHLNEGHAAFAAVQRIREMIARGSTYDDAVEAVRARTVFTTHTPVPAGHDRYDRELVCHVMAPVLKAAGLSDETLIALGDDPADDSGKFCMTVLALRLAEHVNGVAQLHAKISRDMWGHLYPDTDDVPIGGVTNGVHTRTWMAPVAQQFWRDQVGLDVDTVGPNDDAWDAVGGVDPAALWSLRQTLRSRLVRFVRRRLMVQAQRAGGTPAQVASCERVFDEHALTICFARRFATYKRAPLIFRDPDRLHAMLCNPDRPVQLIFAGKAHPRDDGGQEFLRQVFGYTLDERFHNHVAVLEEYDMHVGRMLTSGADVWLNNPRRPHEASGTSGMKPPLHGGINCSILDGWWPEGFDQTNGWVIGDTHEADESNEEAGDARDAIALYEVLEQQVVPAFYECDDQGLPQAWLKRAIRSATTVPRFFSTDRMVMDYVERAYHPASLRVVETAGSRG